MPVRSKKRKPNKKKNPISLIIKKFRKIFAVVVLVLVSVGVIGGYSIYNGLNKQLAGAESSSSLDQSYYTVLFGVVDDVKADAPTLKDLEFRVFDLENHKILSYAIPTDYQIDLHQKFGQQSVSKLFALGKLESSNPQIAAKFVNDAVTDLFAFPVDRYVFVNNQSSWSWKGLFSQGSFLNIFFNLTTHKHEDDLITNTKLDELYKMSQFIAGLPDDRIINSINDDNLRDMTISSKFAADAANIAVLNASDKEGVASYGARVVNNLGGRVVAVDNSENRFDESFIVSDEPQSYSVGFLSRVFGITKIISKDDAKQYVTDNELYRADILLILSK